MDGGRAGRVGLGGVRCVARGAYGCGRVGLGGGLGVDGVHFSGEANRACGLACMAGIRLDKTGVCAAGLFVCRTVCLAADWRCDVQSRPW
jgi:hypothetical protein